MNPRAQSRIHHEARLLKRKWADRLFAVALGVIGAALLFFSLSGCGGGDFEPDLGCMTDSECEGITGRTETIPTKPSRDAAR